LEAGVETGQTLTITRPDDWHLHLRDGAQLAAVAADSARRFARALVMPNLAPPILDVAQAGRYRRRILDALPAEASFQPWMALYLSEETPLREVARACDSGFVLGMKYYPAGATTGAEFGVRSPERVYPVLEEMEKRGLPLQVHGELADPEVDVFSREAFFIERVLLPLLRRFPGLRVVLEHVSTREGVQCVRDGPQLLAATITPQHLLLSRNAMFAQGRMRPHHYCLPVPQAEQHRQALIEAATGGHPRFFLGTDSAPHSRPAKERGCACAGIYSAHAAVELYAEVFEAAGRLERLEAFAAFHGADFYRLPRNGQRLVLHRADWTVPSELPFGPDTLVPLRAGQPCHWQLRAA